ncbi:MAG TPA: DedA family protein [Candidatus Baltobacteraceae bacterium]|nr:DedA family protein [Candidatus Baltobacteraceae bacterium]
MKEAIGHLVAWYQQTLDAQGYPLIAALMLMESTIIPIPSEMVIPFAAHQARVSGKLTLWGVVLAGALGSWVGATVMYWASRLAGRPLVLRYGAYFLVPEAKLHAAERWAARFGPFGVFAARLLPVVRHLIGIPMGIVKMDFLLYSLFTLAGSVLWCAVLAWVGVAAGNDPKLLQGDLHHVALWLTGAVLVLGSLYYFLVHRHFTTDPKKL